MAIKDNYGERQIHLSLRALTILFFFCNNHKLIKRRANKRIIKIKQGPMSNFALLFEKDAINHKLKGTIKGTGL